MKRIAALIIIFTVGILYGVIVYQTKDTPSPQSVDHNVPGATTGLGRNSPFSPDPAASR
jgi:hypothetical protein